MKQQNEIQQHIPAKTHEALIGNSTAVFLCRSSTDSELLWAAFFFFVGCCTFVILRRAGLVKMALTVCLDAPQVF